MRTKILEEIFWCAILLLLTSAHALPEDVGSSDNVDIGCWNDNQSCLIHATLHRLDEPIHSAGLTFDIDCQLPSVANATDQSVAPAGQLGKTHLLQRLEHVKSVRLDGCHTPLSVKTFGLEYLPNCANVPELIVEHFHADVLHPLLCATINGSDDMRRLEVLSYRHNELVTIGENAFSNVPQLRELYFNGNSLRYIAPTAFDALRMVERIQIEYESMLVLKDAGLFERSSVSDLHLIALRRVTPILFERLPETLRQSFAAHTRFSSDDDGANDDVLTVYNPQLLRNISIIDCALKSFILHESITPSVRHINLSGNALLDFSVEYADDRTGIISEVETLDLSANGLVSLPYEWMSDLGKLRSLSLRGNLLTTLALRPLLDILPAVRHIDVRNNKLSQLIEVSAKTATTAATAAAYWDYIRLQIDGNPWNCMWLLDFSQTHPEKFRIFQYDKFISQINVNGLNCISDEALLSGDDTINSTTSATNVVPLQKDPVENNSSAANTSSFAVIYGGPWDYKRSQRAEALIIVFMLPLGVAFLFIILYMWINCQKIFHLSYYRSCPWSQRNVGERFRSAERFDVVRQLPPMTATSPMTTNNNDGYETPLSGVGSICNCNNITSSPYGNDKCLKSHHITYVELPPEPPYKIYEEIIGDEETVLDTDTDTYAQPFYDHLSYSQPRNEANESI